MGQQQVHNILKEDKRKWLTTREIANKLDISLRSVVLNLNRLRKAETILYRETYRVVKPAGKRAILIYRYKE